jgi:hypothetical protein
VSANACPTFTKPPAILSNDELALEELLEKANARIREATAGIDNSYWRSKVAAAVMEEVMREAKAARRSGPR